MRSPVSAPPTKMLPLVWAASWLLIGAAVPALAADLAVPTTVVQAGQVGRSLALDGAIQPVRQATVSAQTAGNVLALNVKAGDRVKAGQALAQLDARVAQAGVAQSDAGVAQADANLRNARTQLDRTRELRGQGYISQSALDNAENQFKAAEAAVAQARAGRSQAALAQGFASVHAPFDGTVLATHLDTGDLAAPGRPIVTVYAPGALRAVVQVPASQAVVARAAQRIEVQLPDQRWVAPIKKTDLPTADAVSQTVEWRLDLSGADSALLMPGQTVRVRFADAAAGVDPKAATLSVPEAAVLRRGELTAVYVAQEQRFVLRAIRAGAAQGGSTEVLAGLKAGERIATDAVKAGLAGARP
ncbi:efflux RND transporter periplasmic adaptor subunit [Sphaerotilus sp.]|uniref:efflux RND transporter periplasmic adaptor subunit n=1 Tax=Sphaerotilus sp. TaxID=2093942 RepID=UPI002ACDBDEA|nr:efflux RND transporter periplasmic adaptor subunit [Sphaerotilus sp.]MDZ7854930.1 efflux RND transporter periplasmic adaptor subunit [Sphaerotilus sp.]